MPQIIDVIRTTNPYNDKPHFWVIVDEKPNFVYERRDNCLVASDDGFYDCLFYERPTKYSRAFAGREFELPMKDGSVIKATGQWWDGGHQANAPEPIVDIGLGTIERLRDCYVFSSHHVSTEKLNAWLRENEPSDDYRKYDKHK